MNESKLLSLLKLLDKEERKRLGKFVESPYFNTNSTIVRFWEILSRFAPEYDSRSLKKEAFFKKLFPEEKTFQEKRMRDLMSEFTKVVEKFMQVEQLEKQPASQKIALAEFLREKEAYGGSLDSFKEALAQPLKPPVKNLLDYWQEFYAGQGVYFNPELEKSGSEDKYLREAMDQLDQLFVLGKLRLACELNWRRKILSEKGEIRDLDLAMQTARKFFDHNPLIHIYYNLLRLQERRQDLPLFQETQFLFFRHEHQLDQAESQVLFFALANYASLAAGAGHVSFRHELLRWYQRGLQEKKWLFFQGKLRESTFINIAVTAAICKEFDFFQQFLREFLLCVPEENQSDAKNVAEAYYHFHRGNIEKVRECTDEITSRNYEYKLRLKVLYLRSQYEFYCQDESHLGALGAACDNFRRYLKKDSPLSLEKKAEYQNMLNMMLRLIRNRKKQQFGPEVRDELREKLQQMKPVMALEWLEQKIEEMVKKRVMAA